MKLLILLYILSINFKSILSDNDNDERKLPTILISTLIRNKAHTLPYFLTYLEHLDYPKSRISLWLRSDHNEDNSIELIHLWLNKTSEQYHSIDFKFEESPALHKNETSATDWTKERFSHIIKLKEDAFEKAEKLWADYIFFLDADVFLTNPGTLKFLVGFDLPIVAPMLNSEGLYSNFWCGMSEDYYYERTDEYKEIYENKKLGNYPVPMVHSAVLVNLKFEKSKYLTFDPQKLIENQEKNKNAVKLYDGPVDDIIVFAISANSTDTSMYISNIHHYGFILQPLEKDYEIRQDYIQLQNIKLNIITLFGEKPSISKEFKKFVFSPELHKLSLDHIYMINLERRSERRRQMQLLFEELGLDVEYFPAVDGQILNLNIIKEMGIKFLPGYEDPYQHRQMTMGEIGCFLSHYRIWQKMIEFDQKEVLILEDDVRFEPYFKENAISILNQARGVGKWDLIYFGRKRLEDQDEPWVGETKNLVHVGYSYWTLGYVISLEGAKKLVNSKPLEKLLPVDEYLPVMFNRHPNDSWSKYYDDKNLLAYSATPLLMYPTHYTGDDGYISDTEDSLVTTPTDMNSNTDAQLKSDKATRGSHHLDEIIDEVQKNNLHNKNNILNEHLGKSIHGEL